MNNNLSFTVHSKKNSATKVQSLILEGDLGISNAEAIKAKLLSFDFKYDVNIQLINVETLDLTGVQIIYSLIKTLVAKGLKTTIKSELSERTEESIRKSGFLELIKT